jgi:hypothetical protein
LFAYATSRVKVAGANEALVRTGGVFGGAPAQLTVVRAGRVIVLPLVHKLGRLHLSARQINIALSDAVTKQGIKVAVQGVATVRSEATTSPSAMPPNASSIGRTFSIPSSRTFSRALSGRSWARSRSRS